MNYNNYEELVRRRESCRKYQDKLVSHDDIIKIIDVAKLAPSACNSQPWKFIVVDEDEKKKKLAKSLQSNLISINKYADDVPCFVVLTDEKRDVSLRATEILKAKDFSTIDAGIIVSVFTQTAVTMGLDTCIIGWFDELKIKKILDIPKNRRVKIVMAIGYRDTNVKVRNKIRNNTEDFVSFNKF